MMKFYLGNVPAMVLCLMVTFCSHFFCQELACDRKTICALGLSRYAVGRQLSGQATQSGSIRVGLNFEVSASISMVFQSRYNISAYQQYPVTPSSIPCAFEKSQLICRSVWYYNTSLSNATLNMKVGNFSSRSCSWSIPVLGFDCNATSLDCETKVSCTSRLSPYTLAHFQWSRSPSSQMLQPHKAQLLGNWRTEFTFHTLDVLNSTLILRYNNETTTEQVTVIGPADGCARVGSINSSWPEQQLVHLPQEVSIDCLLAGYPVTWKDSDTSERFRRIQVKRFTPGTQTYTCCVPRTNNSASGIEQCASIHFRFSGLTLSLVITALCVCVFVSGLAFLIYYKRRYQGNTDSRPQLTDLSITQSSAEASGHKTSCTPDIPPNQDGLVYATLRHDGNGGIVHADEEPTQYAHIQFYKETPIYQNIG